MSGRAGQGMEGGNATTPGKEAEEAREVPGLADTLCGRAGSGSVDLAPDCELGPTWEGTWPGGGMWGLQVLTPEGGGVGCEKTQTWEGTRGRCRDMGRRVEACLGAEQRLGEGVADLT